MPTGKVYSFDPKINYDITDKVVKGDGIKQFSTDNFIEYLPLSKMDYGLTENTGDNNLDEPEPEVTEEET